MDILFSLMKLNLKDSFFKSIILMKIVSNYLVADILFVSICIYFNVKRIQKVHNGVLLLHFHFSSNAHIEVGSKPKSCSKTVRN